MKNISIFNSESFKKFLNFLYRKVKILSYAFCAILIGIGIILTFYGYNGYVYFIFGISLPLFVYIFLKIVETDAIKTNTLLKYETIQTYEFGFESFSLSQKSELGLFEDTYFYNEFLRVIKTKEYYYFFINRSQALIVDIAGFKDGDDEKLDEILKKQIEDNFVNKGKKYKKHIVKN